MGLALGLALGGGSGFGGQVEVHSTASYRASQGHPEDMIPRMLARYFACSHNTSPVAVPTTWSVLESLSVGTWTLRQWTGTTVPLRIHILHFAPSHCPPPSPPSRCNPSPAPSTLPPVHEPPSMYHPCIRHTPYTPGGVAQHTIPVSGIPHTPQVGSHSMDGGRGRSRRGPH